MIAHEMMLDHPIEIDGVRYEKLAVADYAAIADFKGNNRSRASASLAKVYGAPRKVIRHLHPADYKRAGDLLCDVLVDYVHSIGAPYHG